VENILKKNCAIVYPFLEEASWKNTLRSKDNLALGYLAANIRAHGLTVEIIHAEHLKKGIDEVVDLLEELMPSVIGFSCTSQRAYPIVKEYAKRLKKITNIPIIIGGIFPTVAYQEIMNDCPDIDAICRGEGEELIVEFIQAVLNGTSWDKIEGLVFRKESEIIVNKSRKDIQDLDSLPFPAKDFFNDMKYELDSGLFYINISAGRGCYAACSFCCTYKLYYKKNRRVRTVKSVVDEIENLHKLYSVSHFKIVDEVFIDKKNTDWVFAFCEEIKKRELKIKFHVEARVECIEEKVISALVSAGMNEILVGLESGNERILKLYKKGHTLDQAEKAVLILNKFDLNVQFGYIMIDPQLTFEELEINFNWLMKIGGYSKKNLFGALNIYYGTDIYNALKNEQLINGVDFYQRVPLYYKDDRVKLFSRFVEDAKNLLKDYNYKFNDIVANSIKNKELWREKVDAIQLFELEEWNEIIQYALKNAKNEESNFQKWNEYMLEKSKNMTLELKKVWRASE
jgi:radical SAM superfamily enzyme YgiQ (UPF0313 family)